MRKYSVFAIAREAMRGHKGWEEQWSSPEPRSEYDVVIVGAGGHGLATAYYLAKVHGITNVAVLEKGGSAAATPAATPPSSAPTTSTTRAQVSTTTR